jgi:Zn-dependent M28 family amino/carboxypeptidase
MGIATPNSVAGHVLNVMARVPGRGAGPAVLLVAHYDSVPASPGAGDDAAAVAALLETLRALRSSPPVTHDVIALFTDGEEAGLIGSAAFVSEHPWARDVGMVLNFEGRGTGGPSFMFETAVGNLDAVSVLRHVPEAVANSLSVTVYRYLPNDTDLSELTVLGQPALNFAFIKRSRAYHTAQDDLTHLDAGSVQHHDVRPSRWRALR